MTEYPIDIVCISFLIYSLIMKEWKGSFSLVMDLIPGRDGLFLHFQSELMILVLF